MRKLLNILLIGLFFWGRPLYSQAIKMRSINQNQKILYFKNDSLLINSDYLDFSPDSQLCVVRNNELNFLNIYNNNKQLIASVPASLHEYKKVMVANDHRFIVISEIYTENLRVYTKVEFYSNTGDLLKDTTCYSQLDASFMDNNELAIIHSIGVWTVRGSSNILDTKLLIFDSNFNLKISKAIIYPSKKLSRPTFDSIEKKYSIPLKTQQNLKLDYIEFKIEN